jgi:hypothetical protein
VRLYLIVFNISAAGWAHLALNVVVGQRASGSACNFFKPLVSYVPTSIVSLLIPKPKATNGFSNTLAYYLHSYIPATYNSTFSTLGPVQSLAALEIFHVLFGLVRSPLPTTVIQVSFSSGVSLSAFLTSTRVHFILLWSLFGLSPKYRAMDTTRCRLQAAACLRGLHGYVSCTPSASAREVRHSSC